MKRILSLVLCSGIFFVTLISPVSSLAYYTNMPASVVIGQTNFSNSSTNQGGSVTSKGFNSPLDVATDGKRLIVSDFTNNRVLIYNSIPTSNNAGADVVIGQQNMISSGTNQGTTRSARTLSGPVGVSTDGTRLFIADLFNCRVLVYNQIPTTNNAAADVVIGQADMSSATCTASSTRMNRPFNAVFDPNTGKLFISELNNNRVLIYNTVPTTNGAAADVVLGQTNFTNSTANQGGTATAYTLNSPRFPTVIDGKLFVQDFLNSRILIWNTIPTTNNAAADIVIGQQNMTSSSVNQGGSARANTLNQSEGIFWDGRRLFVSDTLNNRTLIFNSLPSSNNTSADIVLGQSNFTSNSANQGGNVASNTFNVPAGIKLVDNKMIVADFSNNRVLIFNETNSVPKLGLTGISGSPDTQTSGRLRASGTLSVDGGLYNLWKVEASVNGGGYSPVTSAPVPNSVQKESTLFPGNNQTILTTFYHDFEPWNYNGQPEGNGNKQDWIDKQEKMIQDYGYTLKLKGYNNNADSNEVFFYFRPFTILSPSTSTTDIPTLPKNPTITFLVNKNQKRELKENLVHYEISLRKQGTDSNGNEYPWEKYIDNIPVDFDTVKEYDDNLRKGTYDSNTDGNGVS